jgi:Ig-like domain from next to BRCA1 gene
MFSVTLWFNQDMFRFNLRLNLLAFLFTLIFASACAPQSTPTPFRPPTQLQPTQILATTTPVPAIFTSVPTVTVTSTVAGPCTNNLEFLQDVTIPDNTTISLGSTIDKQWLVKNSGTCNWDSTYHIKWVGGDPLSANQEQVLYPARAGTQATLQILFTAPTVEGTYESAWQAYGPDGTTFGDPIYMKVIVQ